MEIDFDLLRAHVANGIVREQKHSRLPLAIYNYSERCQYDRLWDDLSLQCRGLILYGNTVVARPFRKFFNDTEHKPGEIPWHLPCEVTEKMDGSLLIMFNFDGQWRTATRGSFTSEQAAKGKEIFDEHYGFVPLDPAITYLFEVLYPGNRIVLDYGDTEDVVLLAMIETATGVEIPLSEASIYLRHVRRLPPTANAAELRSIIRDDEEGYVVRFENGFRVKVKGQRYMDLHRIISGVSSRSVWEALSGGLPFDELLTIIPDEFSDWVRQEKSAFEADYARLLSRTDEAVKAVATLPDRKSQALHIMAEYKDICGPVFQALDRKPFDKLLWKHLYPEFRRPRASERIEA
jgi:RNA ligase